LYRGSLPFLTAYTLCVSLQFTIYEYIIKFFKNHYKDDYSSKEIQSNIVASFLGGAIGSGLTNAFEVLTINK